MKKTLLLTVGIFLLLATASFADTSSNRQAALDLLEITGSRGIHDRVMHSVQALMLKEFELVSSQLPPEGRKDMESIRQDIMQWLSETLSWDAMKTMYVDIYTKAYTEDDLRELIKFYQTPLGQKMLKKSPALIESSMQASQDLFKNKLPELKDMLNKSMARLAKKYKSMRTFTQKERSEAYCREFEDQALRQKREARWCRLIGTWFGTYVKPDGSKYLWISEKKYDGTYKVRFRDIDPSGKKADRAENGEWGVSGDILFQIFKNRIVGNKSMPVDATDPKNRDAYRILSLSDGSFEYEHLDVGIKYTAKKVPAGFAFPE